MCACPPHPVSHPRVLLHELFGETFKLSFYCTSSWAWGHSCCFCEAVKWDFIYLLNLLTLSLRCCVVVWHRILTFALLQIMSCSIAAFLTRIIHINVKYTNVSAKLVVFSFFEHMQGAASGEEIRQQTFLHAASSGTSPCESCGGGELRRRAAPEGEVLEEEERLSILPFPLSMLPAHVLLLWRGWAEELVAAWERCHWASSLGHFWLLGLCVLEPLLLADVFWVRRDLYWCLWWYVLLHRFLFSHSPVQSASVCFHNKQGVCRGVVSLPNADMSVANLSCSHCSKTWK